MIYSEFLRPGVTVKGLREKRKKKLNSHLLNPPFPPLQMSRILMALKSDIPSELAWALSVLAILSADTRKPYRLPPHDAHAKTSVLESLTHLLSSWFQVDILF